MASISPAPTSNLTSSAGESFAALFEESLNRKEMRIGEVITAEVVSVDENFVVVNAGLKSESIIAVDEFRNDAGQVEVKPGDFVSVSIEALEDGYGATRLSRDKAKRMAAWRRVKHPSEVLNVGDEVTAKVLKFDAEKNRVSLGLKQLGEDPWVGIARRYPQGTRLFGKVTNLTDYGAFVEVESGIEGLVHVSEMDWTNKNVHPSKVVQVGDEVEVMILEIDEERRRISLGMKQCMPNPWEDFAREYKKGDRVKGQIKSITDFGVFVGLPGGIDGLVHLSDLSWSAAGEEAVKNFKKGEDVEAVVLSIDVERERISLGVKQLEGDPFTNFIASHEKNSLVGGTVKSVDAKGAVIALGGDVEGYLRASEFSRERVDDLRSHLKEGDTVQAMIINVDRKNRSINVSVKARDLAEETEAMKQLRSEQAAASAGATNLGALLRAKLDKSGSNPQQ